ncbi:MAG: CopG family transcriptional regulator [Sulfolobaceae archaeon]
MGRSVVISVRIPEELKEELERYNIDEAEVIRRALINEVKKAKAKELEKEANKIRDVLSKIPVEEVTEKIREDRESK